jgi:16S rRNA processing protein RimM
VGKPHGVRGDVLVDIITDFPERLSDGVEFGLGSEDGPVEYFQAVKVRYHRGRWLVSPNGVRDRNTVETWRGLFIFLPEQSLDELPQGYYYEHHLQGLECRSPDGESLGTVIGLDPGSSQSRLIVKRGQREFLIPYVPQIVQNVDLEAQCVVVDPIPGLLDDNALES